MLLILTSHDDLLLDQLLLGLDGESIFRFNIDAWRDYKWHFTPQSYKLTSPTGQICTEEEIKAVWLRPWKFHSKVSYVSSSDHSLETWFCKEIEMLIAGICDLALRAGKLKSGMKRAISWSPIYQLRMAARYFSVPQWEMIKGEKTELRGKVLAKAQTKTPLTQGRPFAPCLCDLETCEIDMNYPWFLQTYIEDAIHSIAVTYIDGSFFASRHEKEVSDPRTQESSKVQNIPHTLSSDQQTRLESLIKDQELSVAELHLVSLPDDSLTFLSFQPFLQQEQAPAALASLVNKINSTLLPAH